MFKARKICVQLNRSSLFQVQYPHDVWAGLMTLLYAFTTFVNAGGQCKTIEIHATGDWSVVDLGSLPELFWPIQKIHPRTAVRLLGFDQAAFEALSPLLDGRTEDLAVDAVLTWRKFHDDLREPSVVHLLKDIEETSREYKFWNLAINFDGCATQSFKGYASNANADLGEDQELRVQGIISRGCLDLLMAAYTSSNHKKKIFRDALRTGYEVLRKYKTREQTRRVLNLGPLFAGSVLHDALQNVEREVEAEMNAASE